MHLDSDCSLRTHVGAVVGRIRSRSWALARLRKAGMSEERLLRTYKTIVRPLAEYVAPAWGSMITAAQSHAIERQQTFSLRHIYGAGISARKMLDKSGPPTLRKRREDMTLRFANKCITNPRCAGWFEKRQEPRYSRRKNTSYDIFKERPARTDRHRNGPLNYMTRLLNRT